LANSSTDLSRSFAWSGGGGEEEGRDRDEKGGGEKGMGWRSRNEETLLVRSILVTYLDATNAFVKICISFSKCTFRLRSRSSRRPSFGLISHFSSLVI
jgi:hypothetical protein